MKGRSIFNSTESPSSNNSSVADFSLLYLDLRSTIFSFFKTRDLLNASLINKSSYETCNVVFNQKFQNKFMTQLPKSCNPKLIYMFIKKSIEKEKEFYIMYTLHQIVDQYNSNRELHLLWLKCVITGASFESFNETVKSYKKTINLSLTNPHEKKATEVFHDLLNDPLKLNEINLESSLINLCRINAYYTIQLFFKRNQQLLEAQPNLKKKLFCALLREAICCLQLETVQVLLDLNDYKNEYLLNSQEDNFFSENKGMCLFTSPLYLALSLPTLKQCIVNSYNFLRPTIQFDNPVLSKIIKLLLRNDINPQQNCILAQYDVNKPESIRKFIDINNSDFIEVKTNQSQSDEFKQCIVRITQSNHHPDYVNVEIQNNCINLIKSIQSIEDQHFSLEYQQLLSDILLNKMPLDEIENNISLEKRIKAFGK